MTLQQPNWVSVMFARSVVLTVKSKLVRSQVGWIVIDCSLESDSVEDPPPFPVMPNPFHFEGSLECTMVYCFFKLAFSVDLVVAIGYLASLATGVAGIDSIVM